MNNEIQASLVARTPTPSTARADTTNQTSTDRATDAATDSGNRLPPAEETDREKTTEPPSRAAVEKAAQELAKQSSELGRDLRFEVDDDSGVTVIKVIDPTTDEVVRQIPSEEAVDRASQGANGALNLINEFA